MDYVISDLHFNHNNIIQFERSEFNTIEEHNEYIIKMWNKTVVNPNDRVYVLGDIGFHSREGVKELISRLRGYKILIKGNHDTYTNEFYKTAGFAEVYDHPIYYNKKVILSHEPVREALYNDYIYNIHGHLHNDLHLTENNYICVSAKYLNYKPMKLIPFVNNLKVKERKESLGNEWYFGFYDFNDYELQMRNNRAATVLTKELKKPCIKGTFITIIDNRTIYGDFNKCVVLGYRYLKKFLTSDFDKIEHKITKDNLKIYIQDVAELNFKRIV